MEDMSVPFRYLSASRYAGSLHAAVNPHEPHRLVDLLLIGALIEARSCERFAVLAPRLPDNLGRFYTGLLESEARHFEHYLAFARAEGHLDDDALGKRLAELQALEADLIVSPDEQFRFHSGVPAG